MCFSGSEETYDVTYSAVSNITKSTAVQSKPGEGPAISFMSFTGYSLQEHRLKDDLRSCAISVSNLVTTPHILELTQRYYILIRIEN
mgnify:FL=1